MAKYTSYSIVQWFWPIFQTTNSPTWPTFPSGQLFFWIGANIKQKQVEWFWAMLEPTILNVVIPFLHFDIILIIVHWYGILVTLQTQNVYKISQHRALRCIFNDLYHLYEELRSKANIPLVYIERLQRIMIEVYTICNSIWPAYCHILFWKALCMIYVIFMF